MKIYHWDFAIFILLALILGWFLGRFTEAIALGNISF